MESKVLVDEFGGLLVVRLDCRAQPLVSRNRQFQQFRVQFKTDATVCAQLACVFLDLANRLICLRD